MGHKSKRPPWPLPIGHQTRRPARLPTNTLHLVETPSEWIAGVLDFLEAKRDPHRGHEPVRVNAVELDDLIRSGRRLAK